MSVNYAKHDATLCPRRPQLQFVKTFETAWTTRSSGGARTAMQTEHCRPYLQYPVLINMLFPSCSRTRSISLEKRPPDVNDLFTRSQATNEKNLRLVPDLNHARPYSTFRWKSSTFHDLAPILFMFFQSRIDATHPCIIGHTVYRKHVRSSPGVHIM